MLNCRLRSWHNFVLILSAVYRTHNLLMKRNTPTFFIVGAPKAGTDALYYELNQHPEIYMSPLKEPCYFSSEIRPKQFIPELQDHMREQLRSTKQYTRGNMREPRFGGIVSDWRSYLRLFQGARSETALGEGSVCYLWSKSAPRAIASRLPHSKIIIILMDPALRAFAQYRKSVSQGYVRHNFREHLERCLRNSDDRFSLFHPFLEFGMYGQQVKRYISVFPSEQISVSLYEDVRRNYRQWFAQILTFLGVSKSFAPARFGPDENEELDSAVLQPADRALLVDYYRNDILELEQLMSRNLTSWFD